MAKRASVAWARWPTVRWDPEKERVNLLKHGVRFIEAQAVLRDPLRLVEPDEAHSIDELRTRTIGMTAGGTLLIVITALDASGTIRIISARRPTRRERHAYEDHARRPDHR